MNKEHILSEIKRTAMQNDGVALGKDRFFQETGIKTSDWMGKYWARWGDAVKEAGYTPNELQGKYDDNHVLESYALLVLELGKIPVAAELRLKASQDKSFPSHNVFGRLGSKQQLINKLAMFCEENTSFNNVLEIIKSQIKFETEKISSIVNDASEDTFGYVYMLKAGKFYKVGRSNSIDRRSKELKIQLPEEAEKIHVITTDDPVGIEAYWHKRFVEKRKNGEWFELNTKDVKAFKRRKFM